MPTITFWFNVTDEMYKKKCNGHLRISMHTVEHNQWQGRKIKIQYKINK